MSARPGVAWPFTTMPLRRTIGVDVEGQVGVFGRGGIEVEAAAVDGQRVEVRRR